MNNLRNGAIKNNELKFNVKEYLDTANIIVKRLEERKKVNSEFLYQIEKFIKHAQKQVNNKSLNSNIQFDYFDLIEEEKSLHDRLKEDLERNDELIKSIKKNIDALFR